ncbi:hypothetical protein ACFWMG_21190 [Streptomyces sp. NPDC127074]|uniref:hypothetical protein n=1 Tax=Streptomyces sp. NPDC127074 TaxID=3347130 RepID=UPI00365750F5
MSAASYRVCRRLCSASARTTRRPGSGAVEGGHVPAFLLAYSSDRVEPDEWLTPPDGLPRVVQRYAGC